MGYALYDINGYLGDVASIGAWESFAGHAGNASGSLLSDFVGSGVVRDVPGLKDALATFLARFRGSDPGEVAEILLKLVENASEVVILSDGANDDEPLEALLSVAHDSNYEQVKRDLDSLEEKSREQLIEVITEMRTALISKARKKGPQSLMDDGKLPYFGEYRNVLNEMLRRVWEKGNKDGKAEVKQADMGLHDREIESFADSFTPRAALKWLRNKEIHVAGIFSDGLLSGIKGILVNALKVGAASSVTIERLYDLFEPFLGDPDVLEDGVPPAPYRLNTMLRTVTTEAYNHGRLTQYLDPDILPFIKGIRYSAILDERTTAVCRLLDGKVFKPGDTDLQSLAPPNHFNCRSLLVPVVVGEQVDAGDFITSAEKGRAKQLADEKFLEQEDHALGTPNPAAEAERARADAAIVEKRKVEKELEERLKKRSTDVIVEKLPDGRVRARVIKT